MDKISLELNSDGIRELLKSEEIQEICEKEAHEIASRADGIWDVTSRIGKYRTKTAVNTSDKETYFKCLAQNTLLKAMDGG